MTKDLHGETSRLLQHWCLRCSQARQMAAGNDPCRGAGRRSCQHGKRKDEVGGASFAGAKRSMEMLTTLPAQPQHRCWEQLGPPLKKSPSPNCKDFSCKINPKNNCRAPCGFYILSQGSSTCFWGLVEKYPSPAAVWKGTGFGRGVLGAKHSCQLCSKGLQQQSGS